MEWKHHRLTDNSMDFLTVNNGNTVKQWFNSYHIHHKNSKEEAR